MQIELPDPRRLAPLEHEAWRQMLLRDGVLSRVSHWGEELMVDWDVMSDRAKEQDLEGVRRTYLLIDVLSPEVDFIG